MEEKKIPQSYAALLQEIVKYPKSGKIIDFLNLHLQAFELPTLPYCRPDETAVLRRFSLERACDFTILVAKIQNHVKHHPMVRYNVMFSGDIHEGMIWVSIIVKMLKLKLTDFPYSKLYSGKRYESSNIFIIVSDLSVPEIKRGFPKEYNDIIVFDRPSEAGEGERIEKQH